MSNTLETLIEVANTLDNSNHTDWADSVDKVAKSFAMVKQAQYVGIQGYWIRNERCWSNCYRQKRASKPKTPTQEIWMECQKEYQEQLNKDYGDWDKYASTETNPIKQQDKLFKMAVNNRVDKGEPIGTAIFETIKENINQPSDTLIQSANTLLDLASTMMSTDRNSALKLSRVANEMVKEASNITNSSTNT